eukprot:CAMPEP_0119494704 /NCGR_PEP_ID=MMETSP1344-20130328/18571_1 /TAXON_ID=236787 /ORGANISM="Florenciella parvula, Strain CCMP2471" /LENGTH=68 /DNA_ID=CAMNT_0007530231 /DNA_START=626 /DNA_END=832 /DNA_ORIENTATION=+
MRAPHGTDGAEPSNPVQCSSKPTLRISTRKPPGGAAPEPPLMRSHHSDQYNHTLSTPAITLTPSADAQ